MKALDIETMRNDAMVDSLPEPKIDSRLSDPKKIEAAKTKAKTEQISKMALSPLWGRVASFVAVGPEGVDSVGLLEPSDDPDRKEQELIMQLYDSCLRGDGRTAPEICTWNGMGFDIPFVYKRAAILGLVLPGPKLNYWCKRYTVTPHLDLMQIWANWDNRAWDKLDVVAKAVLGAGKVEFDVATIPDLLNTAKGREQLIAYNTQDAVLTWELNVRFSGTLY